MSTFRRIDTVADGLDFSSPSVAVRLKILVVGDIGDRALVSIRDITSAVGRCAVGEGPR
jgi:hypothetical protein